MIELQQFLAVIYKKELIDDLIKPLLTPNQPLTYTKF
jgi:hypothetical protein